MLDWLILLASLIAAALTVVLVLLYAGITPTPWRLLKCAMVAAIVLQLLMVLVLNSLPGFFNDNESAYSRSKWFREITGLRTGAQADHPVDLILIDNAQSKKLIADPTHFAPPTLITDRSQLGELLNWLADRSDGLDHVVCDMVFLDTTAHDSALARAMWRLINTGKLILAQGDTQNVAPLRFPAVAMGNATTSLQQDRVAWHELHPDTIPSLPYAMYLRSTGTTAQACCLGGLLRETHAGCVQYRHAAFMPGFHQLDTKEFLQVGDDGRAHSMAPLSLNEAVSDFGRFDLEQRLSGPTRPLVFIGGFSAPRGESSDQHGTFAGREHGSLLILHMYLELMAGAHHVTLWSLGAQWLLLVALLFLLLIKPWDLAPMGPVKRQYQRPFARLRTLCKPMLPSPVETPAAITYNGTERRGMAKVIWRSVWGYVRENFFQAIPLLLLAVLFVLLELATGQHVNLAALITYFVILHLLIGSIHLSLPPDHAPTNGKKKRRA